MIVEKFLNHKLDKVEHDLWKRCFIATEIVEKKEKIDGVRCESKVCC